MTVNPTLRRGGMVALAAGLMVLVGGCFAAEMNLTINDDDADVSYTLLIDVERLQELADVVGSELPDLSSLTGEALVDRILEGEDPCAELRSALPDREISTSDVEEGTQRGVRCTITKVPFDALAQLGEGTSVRVIRDGSTTSVEIDLEGVDELTADGDQAAGGLGLSFDELYRISFVVTAPGSLGEHNATSTEGATAEWVVTAAADFVENGTARMRATWSGGGDGGGSGAAVFIALGVIAVVVVAAVVIVLVRRRSSSTPGSPLPPPPPPPTPQVGGGA